MVHAAPTLLARARGALLGHAAGNALGVPTEGLGSAEAIAARYPGGLRDIVRADSPASPWDDDVAMALDLADELVEPEPDLRRLALRWVAWMERDGRGIGHWTRIALRHLAAHDAPLESSEGQAGNGAIMRCLPVALAAHRSPQTLLSLSYHTALLTHPDPRCAWGAVAVNVAAACLLQGRRDFLPEVVEVLRLNDAPDELLAAVRRIPFEKRDDLPVTGPAQGYAVHCVEIGLWFAHHEPQLERGLIWLANAGGDTDTNAAVAGGLMGARDGEQAVPERWVAQLADPDRLRRAAERLVGGSAGSPPTSRPGGA